MPFRLKPIALASILASLALDAAAADTFTVEMRSLPDRKAVFGQVDSAEETVARTRISGTVVELTIDEGDTVEAGERIARVDDPKLALESAAIESRIEAARAKVRVAELEQGRMATLRERGTVSQSTLDTAQSQLDVALGELAALEAERDLVQQRRAEGDVLAPESGRVLDVHVTDAQVVRAGEVIATIACECYVLRLRLPERHARFIAEGDMVLVGERGMSTADQDLREGTVRQVYPRLESGRVIADVMVSGLGDYFVGERTRVFVATGQRAAYVVPRGYVYTRSGVSHVWVEGTGPVVVQPGQVLAEGIEILAGVEAGDVLVAPGTGEAAGIAGTAGR